MRVILAHKFHYLAGGAEVFVFEVARVLREHGHEVAHFSTLDERNLPAEHADYFVKAPEYRAGSVLKRAVDFTKIVYYREARKKFAQLIQDFKPDIVHAFGIYVQISPSILYACKEAGVPVVMSCNDHKHICANHGMYHHGRDCDECKFHRFWGPLLRPVANRCCHGSLAFSLANGIEVAIHGLLDAYRRNVHTFLFASEYMARRTEEFWAKDTFRWRMLRNPLDISSQKYSEESDDFCLYFGRLMTAKGCQVLVEAMHHVHPGIRLVIVGDGPQEEELHEQVARLGLSNVEFTGPKWGEELDPYLARARFVIVPSVWNENFPYVVLQAFASGKPVIGASRGGIPELVCDGKYGLVYDAHDPEALARCIERLWDAPEEAKAMGKAGREFVEREFNDERFYQSLTDIYREVLA